MIDGTPFYERAYQDDMADGEAEKMRIETEPQWLSVETVVAKVLNAHVVLRCRAYYVPTDHAIEALEDVEFFLVHGETGAVQPWDTPEFGPFRDETVLSVWLLNGYCDMQAGKLIIEPLEPWMNNLF